MKGRLSEDNIRSYYFVTTSPVLFVFFGFTVVRGTRHQELRLTCSLSRPRTTFYGYGHRVRILKTKLIRPHPGSVTI